MQRWEGCVPEDVRYWVTRLNTWSRTFNFLIAYCNTKQHEDGRGWILQITVKKKISVCFLTGHWCRCCTSLYLRVFIYIMCFFQVLRRLKWTFVTLTPWAEDSTAGPQTCAAEERCSRTSTKPARNLRSYYWVHIHTAIIMNNLYAVRSY